MLERFRRGGHDRGHDDAGGVATSEREERGRRFERDRDPDARHEDAHEARPETARDVRARQYEEFGGFNIGAAFFGWLVATGLAVLLTAILSATGAAIGLTEVTNGDVTLDDADTVSLVGAIFLVLILLLAYFTGGYVAGRMSRFDGGRQGLGTWLFGVLIAVLLAVLGAIAGSEYNVLAELDQPRVPVDEGDLVTGGVISLIVILLGTLIAAIGGGKVGERYHRRVDHAGYRG